MKINLWVPVLLAAFNCPDSWAQDLLDLLPERSALRTDTGEQVLYRQDFEQFLGEGWNQQWQLDPEWRIARSSDDSGVLHGRG